MRYTAELRSLASLCEKKNVRDVGEMMDIFGFSVLENIEFNNTAEKKTNIFIPALLFVVVEKQIQNNIRIQRNSRYLNILLLE